MTTPRSRTPDPEPDPRPPAPVAGPGARPAASAAVPGPVADPGAASRAGAGTAPGLRAADPRLGLRRTRQERVSDLPARRSRTNRIHPLTETISAAAMSMPSASRNVDWRSMGSEGYPSGSRRPPVVEDGRHASAGDAARRADAREADPGDPRGGLQLRAEVGRLPLDRVPRRRRGRDRQQERAPDEPLLPRGGRGGPREPPRTVRRRRRDRRPRPGGPAPRVRDAPAADPSGGEPRQAARRADAGPPHHVRSARPRRSRPDAGSVRRAASTPSRTRSPAPARRSTSRPPPGIDRSPNGGSTSSRERGSTG